MVSSEDFENIKDILEGVEEVTDKCVQLADKYDLFGQLEAERVETVDEPLIDVFKTEQGIVIIIGEIAEDEKYTVQTFGKKLRVKAKDVSEVLEVDDFDKYNFDNLQKKYNNNVLQIGIPKRGQEEIDLIGQGVDMVNEKPKEGEEDGS